MSSGGPSITLALPLASGERGWGTREIGGQTFERGPGQGQTFERGPGGRRSTGAGVYGADIEGGPSSHSVLPKLETAQLRRSREPVRAVSVAEMFLLREDRR